MRQVKFNKLQPSLKLYDLTKISDQYSVVIGSGITTVGLGKSPRINKRTLVFLLREHARKDFFAFFPACSLLLQPARKKNFQLFSNLLAKMHPARIGQIK